MDFQDTYFVILIIVKRTFEKPSTLEVIIAGVVSISLLVEVQDVGISSGVGSKDDPVSKFDWEDGDKDGICWS